MSIRFGCESCGRHLEAEPMMIGQRIDCPHCGHRETVPAVSTIGHRRYPEPADVEFHCDGCGQSLVVAAAAAGLRVDCPKCHRPLVVPGGPAERTPPPPPPPAPPDGPRRIHLPERGPPQSEHAIPAPPPPSDGAMRIQPGAAPPAAADPMTHRRQALGKRFSVLRALSVLYKCAAVVAALAAGVAGTVAVLQNRWEAVLVCVGGFALALVLASISQVIDLVIDLELNTRATCILLEDLLRELRTRQP